MRRQNIHAPTKHLNCKPLLNTKKRDIEGELLRVSSKTRSVTPSCLGQRSRGGEEVGKDEDQRGRSDEWEEATKPAQEHRAGVGGWGPKGRRGSEFALYFF